MKTKLIYITIFFIYCSIQAQTTSYIDSTFTQYFRRTKGWIASDATISVPLPNGKVIWLFGDTYLDNLSIADTSVPCLFQVRNSIMVQDNYKRDSFITIIDNSKTGINRTPIKLKDNDTTLFWPGHGFVNGDTAYVFWFRMHHTNYTRYGIYISKIYWPTFTSKSEISLKQVNLPNLETEYGDATLVDSTAGYIYIYGQRLNWIVNEPYIARCKITSIWQQWEYYNGNNWQPNINAAKKISCFPVAPSFSVIKQNNKYYIITQENGYLTCGLGQKIFAYVANSPYGPFNQKKLIYLIRDKYKGSYLITYNATAHPEFTKNNELLISYNVNGICPSECTNAFNNRMNADTYRPRLVRVPFTILDSGIKLPVAAYKVDRYSGNSPLTIQFNANDSYGESDTLKYKWIFGDGSTDTISKTLHTYTKKGQYKVKLIVYDSGKSDSVLFVINSYTFKNNFCRYKK